MQRTVLDWNLPLVAGAAKQLAVANEAGVIDLSRTICATAGTRTGRVLRWHLAALAAASSSRLAPPRLTTPGGLLDALTPPTAAEATSLMRELAWVEAFRSMDAADRSRLGLGDHVETGLTWSAALSAWADLARMSVELHDELAGAGATFELAAPRAAEIAGPREAERWEVLSRLWTRVRDALECAGFTDPTIDRARRSQIAAPSEVLQRVVLIGIVELNALQRAALEAFANRGGIVDVLVHADERWLGALDAFGCVQPRSTSAVEGSRAGDFEPLTLVHVDDSDLTIADRAGDAVQSAIEAIAALPSSAGPSDVTIGIVDSAFAGTLEAFAPIAGVSIRNAAGRPVSSTEPWRTLEALRAVVGGDVDPSFLARLPAAGAWLRTRIGDALAPGRDLVSTLDEGARAARPGELRADPAPRRAAIGAIDQLVQPFEVEPRPLAAWRAPIREALAILLESLEIDPVSREAVAVIDAEVTSWGELPDELSGRVDGTAALALLARRTARLAVPAVPREREVEAIGWLELHGDDAAHQILLGLHEGSVPRAVHGHPFLPNSLRRALGLPDDADRATRDAYLLEAMRRGRSSSRIIVARRSPAGDPVVPSRLLLAVPRTAIAGRVTRLFAEAPLRSAGARGLAPSRTESAFVIPRPPAGPCRLESIAVTTFRRYIACPYRYWLGSQLHLRAVEPIEEQFDQREFGTLAHDVLHAFGADPAIRNSEKPAEILEYLEAALEATLGRLFSGDVPVPIEVQLARLRARLAIFAERQALHRASGWRIELVEWSLNDAAILEVPGQDPVRITGRIDRIDRNERGELLLLDYKTSDSAKTPFEAHHGAKKWTPGKWIDLQLPLYGHLAPAALAKEGIAFDRQRPPLLGYMQLPRGRSGSGPVIAPWPPEALEEALVEAARIVTRIRAGAFWPPTSTPPRIDDWEAICQVRSLGIERTEGEDDTPRPPRDEPPRGENPREANPREENRADAECADGGPA